LPAPARCLATLLHHLHRPLCGGLAEVLVDAVAAWLVITAGYSGAIHRAARRVLVPRRSGWCLGPPAARPG